MGGVGRIISFLDAHSLVNSLYRPSSDVKNTVFLFNLPVDGLKLRSESSRERACLVIAVLLILSLKIKEVLLWQRTWNRCSKDNLACRSCCVVACCSLSVNSLWVLLLYFQLVWWIGWNNELVVQKCSERASSVKEKSGSFCFVRLIDWSLRYTVDDMRHFLLAKRCSDCYWRRKKSVAKRTGVSSVRKTVPGLRRHELHWLQSSSLMCVWSSMSRIYRTTFLVGLHRNGGMISGFDSLVLLHWTHLLLHQFLHHLCPGCDWSVAWTFSVLWQVLVDASISETLNNSFACWRILLHHLFSFVLVVLMKSIPLIDFLQVSADFNDSLSHKLQSILGILTHQVNHIHWKLNQILIRNSIALHLIGRLNRERNRSIISINQNLWACPFLLIQCSYLEMVGRVWEITLVVLKVFSSHDNFLIILFIFQ